MSTRSQNKVVPSSTTPNMAVHPAGSGTGVPGPVPSNPVQNPNAPFITPDGGAVTGVKNFREGLFALMGIFASFLRNPPPDFTRHGKASSKRIAAVPLLVELLREDPSLATIQPDDIAVIAAWADALDLVAEQLSALLVRVEDTVRLLRSQSWSEASAVLVAATHRSKTVPAMAGRILSIRAVLARGKKTDTTAATAAAASHVAGKAQTRATAAQQRAVAASQSHTRTVQAHAANTVVRGTSPVPLANPQGPAASADVAPQGPAPGR